MHNPAERVEEFSTFRKTIQANSQDDVPALAQDLFLEFRRQKFTGSIVFNFNMGGIRGIVMEQIKRVPALEQDKKLQGR